MKISLSDIIKKINSKNFTSLAFSKLNESVWPFLAAKATKTLILCVNNNSQIETLAKQIEFLNPKLHILPFPAWDCRSYDMSDPSLKIQAMRVKTIKNLAQTDKPVIIITTPTAAANKSINIKHLEQDIDLKTNTNINRDQLITQLLKQGFKRVEQVFSPLEFAIRGDILDFYPTGLAHGYRLEFFDDEIESIHILNIQTQRRETSVKSIKIEQLNELILNEKTKTTFLQNYLEQFPVGRADGIYTDIKNNKLPNNAFHFLQLFYNSELKSLLDYLPADFAIFSTDDLQPQCEQFYKEIDLSYNARAETISDEDSYRPLSPENLYLTEQQLTDFFEKNSCVKFNNLLTKVTHDEAVETHIPYNKKSLDKTPLAAVCDDIKKWQTQNFQITISCFNTISAEHISKALHEYGIDNITPTQSPIEHGYIDYKDKIVFLTEQDIFGIKQKIKKRTKSSSNKMIEHLNQLKINDLVVHSKHGIGRFIGIETITTSQTKEQDFAIINYADDNKLYIPIINLDDLSLYSNAETGDIKLDRLGGTAFANRKEKVKKKLLEIAQELIEVASKRKLISGFSFEKVDGMYDEFAEGFEYVLTDDQENCINDVINDMYSSQPMDRLIIGDVGFGKTEVAVRASFVCASNTKQTAVIVPTTLLARQHYENFKQRFERFGIKVAMLSRLNSIKQNNLIKQGLKNGEIDIVIGTHALLAKTIEFKELGLLVIDEEQRFGVKHKERLKDFRNNIDILTLSATPIPRTLQMSVTGIRDLSLITTPPIDRLPIKTSIIKYDSATIKQAINRELFRNGQVYIITPRVEGIFDIAEKIEKIAPQAKIKIAHGQMNRTDLEDTMDEFSHGKFDILIATTIIESGIDIPNANTMIVFDAHKFGLAQLYQIRGRIGRSKATSYAYLLLPRYNITSNAELRLKILKKLDNIGAGFTLASYDMDLRGPGNILGSEQSGHIREVGFAMYNRMLKDAVKKLEKSGFDSQEIEDFSPNINLTWSFLLPNEYIFDSNERLNIYRRLADISTNEEISDLQEELIDRFGQYNEQVANLLKIVEFKISAKELNIENIDVGDKGILIKFRNNNFVKADALLQSIMSRPLDFKLRADQKIFYNCNNKSQDITIANLNKLLIFLSSL